MSNLEEIRAKIGDPAMLEQCAEECMELAHACLKMARKMRGENYTPKTEAEILENLKEEYVDVYLCMNSLHDLVFTQFSDFSDRYESKGRRWYDRVCGDKVDA